MADGIEVQIARILDDYSLEVRAVVEREIDKVSREAVRKLKSTSPSKSGEYAKGWARRKVSGGYVAYNKAKPWLTHLLENGHVTKNKKGTYGRTPAHKHIKPVEEWAETELTTRIEEALR